MPVAVVMDLDQILKAKLILLCAGPIFIPLVFMGKLGRVFLCINDPNGLSFQSILHGLAPKVQRVGFPLRDSKGTAP